MPRRALAIDGEHWTVAPSGQTTAYDRDEFGLVFEKGTGPERVRRVTRYSPMGARRWEAALSQLTDADLHALFLQSQPAWTSPETRYAARRK
jgi:hypothetical protein